MSIDLIALHMLGDYILQTELMAQRKLESAYIRFVHVNAYSLPFLIWATHFYEVKKGIYFFIGVWITHFAIDSYRFAKNHPWPPKSILIDQSLHIITIAVLAHIFLK